MALAKWARSRDPRIAEAKARLAALPESETGRGKAVPFPFVDKAGYKSRHSDAEINAAIEKAPIEDVPIASLHAIQHSVQARRVLSYVEHPDIVPKGERSPTHGGLVDLPIVVEHAGQLLIWDGHHRATAAALVGEKSIRARFVDGDAPEEKKP